jgi:nitrate reductase assembly molybdenum cofactor insertion protein NarJ
MSAEKEALQYLNEIFTIIKETLEEAKENRTNARQLSNEENKALTDITNKLKQVRTNLDKYLRTFRVQTSLTDFGVDIDE